MIPADLAWAFILVNVIIASVVGVLVGLAFSLVFHLGWNIKAAVLDVALAVIGYFAVGLANEIIGQLRQNAWPVLGEKWFFGVAAACVALKQLVRARRKSRRSEPGGKLVGRS